MLSHILRALSFSIGMAGEVMSLLKEYDGFYHSSMIVVKVTPATVLGEVPQIYVGFRRFRLKVQLC